MTSFHYRTSAAQAFSLIEIVLALGVISFAIVGIMGLFPVAMRAAQESQSETRATLATVSRSADEVGRSAAGVRGFFEGLSAPGGTIDRLNQTSDAVRETADNFNFGTLPRANRMTDRIGRASGQLGRVADEIEDNPQSLLLGPRLLAPGPGEPGWTSPPARRDKAAEVPARP